jgi:multidrug resistance efflux pump
LSDQHPLAPHHLPGFITAPGETDVWMVGMGIFLIVAVLAVGNFYLQLHSLPERMAHKSQKLQFDIVAVLGLLALFTHVHLFWIGALLLAMIDLPDFSTPLRSIAGSVEKIAGTSPDDVVAGEVGNAPALAAKQEAALETARRKIAEVEASLIAAKADVLKTEGQFQEAKSAVQQAQDELDVKSELQRRNPGIVPQRDIEKLQVMVDGRKGSLDAANASRQSAELRVSTLLPAEKASAEAALAQAQVDYDKTFVRAGVDGRVEQFALRVGDIVNPLMRPAGILIPEGAGQRSLQAGFGQIEAQVMKVGMVAEAACISKPWTIIPMVVTGVQDYIAAGQFRGGEQLIEAQNAARPGTILVFLEPIYKGGLEGVTAGSSCIVNAYTSNHELISSGKLSTAKSFGLHAIDAVGLVHALLLRIQALLLPTKTLVLSGH